MRGTLAQAAGFGLFLFIPLVLFLFVRHPEPVGASLGAGVALMIGHRFVARPYFERVRGRKCAWCNRLAAEGETLPAAVAVSSGAATRELLACPRHAEPLRRFFAFLDRARLPLRLGIAVPLVLLLGSLAAVAFGRAAPLDRAVAVFQLVVGVTVNVAAWGYFAAPPAIAARAAFPIHNFLLLGVRTLLWIFRAVGLWWIWAGARALLAL